MRAGQMPAARRFRAASSTKWLTGGIHSSRIFQTSAGGRLPSPSLSGERASRDALLLLVEVSISFKCSLGGGANLVRLFHAPLAHHTFDSCTADDDLALTPKLRAGRMWR